MSYRRQKLIDKLAARDGHRCQICFLELDFSARGKRRVTVDHIKPISLGGGRWCLPNMRLAHKKCNERRGNQLSARDFEIILLRSLG